MASSMPGLCTFTATSFPVLLRVALYTCPRLAAAMGDGEIDEKMESRGKPSSVSMQEKASAFENVGSASCLNQILDN